MEIKYEIDDDLVKCFSDTAKQCLIEQSQKYTSDIIKEAESDEQFYEVQGAKKEITHSNVLQATKNYRIVRKRSKKSIAARVACEILLFAAGILFLPEHFVTAEGALNFVFGSIWLIITMLAIICVVCNCFLGGE